MREAFVDAGAEVVGDMGWTGRNYLSLRTRAAALLRSHPIDGIVCYAIGPHLAFGAAARRAGIPMVLHVGNAPPDPGLARTKIGWQIRLGRRSVRRHIACSDYVRHGSIDAYGLRAGEITTIPNGIRMARFAALRDRRAAPGGVTRIGMVGSFEGHKDQATLIRAVARASAAGHHCELMLVGEGSNEEELRRLASSLRIEDAIRWVGATDDVRDALLEMDVFAYSVNHQEGLGIALVEALASGLPVVASDVGACREVLDGGRFGTLVPGDDPAAWAEALVAARDRPAASLADLHRYDIGQTAAAYERELS